MTSHRDDSGSGHSDRRYNHQNKHNQKKRKHGHREDEREERSSARFGMGQSSPLHQQDLPAFNLISPRPSSQDADPRRDGEEWQTIENGRPTKKKKIPKPDSGNYPEFAFSKDSRLQAQIKISDLQNVVLYILADGTAPQFISVRHRNQFRKVVVLMVPGLEESMFESTLEDAINNTDGSSKKEKDRGHGRNGHQGSHDKYSSPDYYYPRPLKSERLPESVKPFADMFEHLWPVKAPGDDKYAKLHSPYHAMLTAPTSSSNKERKNEKKGGVKKAAEPAGWKDVRTPITEYIQTAEELLENDYTLHPASYGDDSERVALQDQRVRAKTSTEDGWVDTSVEKYEDGTPPDNEIESGSVTAGREVLAMDCEMCKTGETEFSLTRISIVGWDGSVILDELVKPEKPIIDYLTMYSGITEKLLAGVTTTLGDIQRKLVEILNPRTILIGHSLNSDFSALKLTHPFIIDTAVIYPHPRGAPLKSSLKWLAQKYLNREIQKGHGTTGPGAGHDSIEDARTCLDLVKQKCEKGPQWGTSDASGENIFKRLARSGIKYKNQGGTAIPGPMSGKSSAAVDWGNPKLGAGNAATFSIGCKSDEEITEGVIRAVKGDIDGLEIPSGGVDFVFGRMRELEALKGWWNNNKAIAADAASKDALAVVDAEAKEEAVELTTTPMEPAAEPTPTHTTLDPTDSLTAPPPATTNTLPPPSLPPTPLALATTLLTTRIRRIHDALPPCTALLLYSGSGDPREMSRLQAMQQTFKREYKVKKWDELSVRWTDTEEQALRWAVAEARRGVGFLGVK